MLYNMHCRKKTTTHRIIHCCSRLLIHRYCIYTLKQEWTVTSTSDQPKYRAQPTYTSYEYRIAFRTVSLSPNAELLSQQRNKILCPYRWLYAYNNNTSLVWNMFVYLYLYCGFVFLWAVLYHCMYICLFFDTIYMIVFHNHHTFHKVVSAVCHGGTGGERRYSSYSYLTSALDGGEWSVSRPGRALPLSVPMDKRLGGPQSRSGRRG
jgi:hypothetical protein